MVARWIGELPLGRPRNDGRVGIRERQCIVPVAEPRAVVTDPQVRAAPGPGRAGLERVGHVTQGQRQLHGFGEERPARETGATLLLALVLAEQRPRGGDKVAREQVDRAPLRLESEGRTVEPVRLAIVAEAHVVLSRAADVDGAVARGQSQPIEIIGRVSAVLTPCLAGCRRVHISAGVIDAVVPAVRGVRARGVQHARLRIGRIPCEKRALRALPSAGVRRWVRRCGRHGAGQGQRGAEGERDNERLRSGHR